MEFAMSTDDTINWAWIRMSLGIVQMAGAFSAAALFFQSGIKPFPLALTAMTAVASLTSFYLFRVLCIHEGGTDQ
jgi:hypothetical protein